MKVFYSSSQFPKDIPTPVVALGNFDGVHRGHQAILQQVLAEAKTLKGTACVYTFDPHPTKILAPQSAPSLIQTLEQKLRGLEEMGLAICIVEPFDAALAQKTPQAFFSLVLQERLQAASVWVGPDFTFGAKRSGDVETLKTLCAKAKIQLHVVEAQFLEETMVRSTQIRQLIRQGNVTSAKELLGRPFSLTGVVVKGQGIGGKTLGIHTANLKVENELLPAVGIYITQTKIRRTREEGRGRKNEGRGTKDEGRRTNRWPSATSVGYNPTFKNKEFSVETHLIGFEGNLLNQKIEVEFLKWLRAEKNFNSAEELAKAIQNDIVETKKYHGLHT